MNTPTKRTLIDHLTLLGTGKIQPSCLALGLCHDLRAMGYVDQATTFVCKYAESWSKCDPYHKYFPVPNPEHGVSAVMAYRKEGNLWDTTPYGDNRRELCLHIAAKLQEEIDSDD